MQEGRYKSFDNCNRGRGTRDNNDNNNRNSYRNSLLLLNNNSSNGVKISFNRTKKISLGGQSNKEGEGIGNQIYRNSNYPCNSDKNKNRNSSSKYLSKDINFFSNTTTKTPHRS